MAEKRFDVRIPDANRQVLDMLAKESAKTGVPEGRLIVVLLTVYAEVTGGGLLPPLASGASVITSHPANNVSSSMRLEAQEHGLQPILDNMVLDSFMNDD